MNASDCDVEPGHSFLLTHVILADSHCLRPFFFFFSILTRKTNQNAFSKEVWLFTPRFTS